MTEARASLTFMAQNSCAAMATLLAPPGSDARSECTSRPPKRPNAEFIYHHQITKARRVMDIIKQPCANAQAEAQDKYEKDVQRVQAERDADDKECEIRLAELKKNIEIAMRKR